MQNGGTYSHILLPRFPVLQSVLHPAELIHHIINQIKSLLIGQSGHNTEHHHLRILVQSKLLLQRQLVGNLVLAECIGRKTFAIRVSLNGQYSS